MNAKRAILGTIGIVAGMLMPVLGSGSAHAAVASTPDAGDRVLIAPPAPVQAQSISPLAVAAPTIQPAVTTTHATPGQPYHCSWGTLCALVWDNTTYDFKVFHLFNCNVYAVSNWNGGGYYYDVQTGNPVSYLYDKGGNELKSFTPDSNQHAVDWTPVWYIDNC